MNKISCNDCLSYELLSRLCGKIFYPKVLFPYILVTEKRHIFSQDFQWKNEYKMQRKLLGVANTYNIPVSDFDAKEICSL